MHHPALPWQFSVPAAEARYADCARTIRVADGSDSDEAACHKLVDALKVRRDGCARVEGLMTCPASAGP